MGLRWEEKNRFILLKRREERVVKVNSLVDGRRVKKEGNTYRQHCDW